MLYPPCSLCSAIWLFELAWLPPVYTCVYRLEIIGACAETVRQRETNLAPALLSIDMDRDCMRLNSFVLPKVPVQHYHLV